MSERKKSMTISLWIYLLYTYNICGRSYDKLIKLRLSGCLGTRSGREMLSGEEMYLLNVGLCECVI